MTKREASENDIQMAVMEWVAFNPDYKKVVFHIANERKCSEAYGAKLKRLGVRAGVSDLFIMRARKGYHGGFIELKRKGGRVSPAQKQFLEDAASEKYFTAVCWSIEECIETLIWYLGV